MRSKKVLGKTGIEVSQICFGSLTMSPLQKNLSFKEGARLITEAYKRGINFIDTADLYDNYAYIREALKSIPREKIVIASKSYAYSYETAKETLEKALREIGTDYIDIFLLHEQESIHTIAGHREAIDYFVDMKKKGLIKAFGISTHFVGAVNASLEYPEIEILHPIINISGIGIVDGSRDDMVDAVSKAKKMGKGIYTMKALGGGNLIGLADESLKYAFNLECSDSVAIGMQNISEIEYNLNILDNEPITKVLKEKISNQTRELKIADWCSQCAKCVDRCQQNALRLENNKIHIDKEKCVFCGYCSRVCHEFCIKVI